MILTKYFNYYIKLEMKNVPYCTNIPYQKLPGNSSKKQQDSYISPLLGVTKH